MSHKNKRMKKKTVFPENVPCCTVRSASDKKRKKKENKNAKKEKKEKMLHGLCQVGIGGIAKVRERKKARK